MALALCYIQTEMEDGPFSTTFKSNINKIGFNEENPFYDYTIHLDENVEYMLAIDQSLKSTGISLVSGDFSFKLVMTVLVNGTDATSRNNYINNLLEFIKGMLVGLNLRFRTVEAVPPSKYRRTTMTLEQLKGALEYGLDQIPACSKLASDEKFAIYPASWKSTVYDKSEERAKGAFNDKYQIARDIVKKFPELSIYLEDLRRFKGHDYDGFDSFGLLFHTRTKCFAEDWSLENVGGKYQLGAIIVLMKYLYPEDIEDKVLRYYVERAQKGLFDTRNWNTSASIEENFIIAANTNKLICMEVLSQKQEAAFLIEHGEEYDVNKILVAVVSKENKMKIGQNVRETDTGFKVKRLYKSS